MPQVIIEEETPTNPITIIGRKAGICYNSNTEDPSENYNRGLKCLKANHGRVLEFVDVHMILDGYSARVIRQWYTHIGGSPTRLQASTRYIDYQSGFEYEWPASVACNDEAFDAYEEAMDAITRSLRKMDEAGIPREDSAMLLPLGMRTKVVCKHNLRNLIDMSHQRMCQRAYWEFRSLFADVHNALREYSEEWAYVVDNYFKPKCEYLGYCPEKNSCGKFKARSLI